MTRFLKKAGYEVDAVADGAEALERMTKRYYPMLVTDWEMPEHGRGERCARRCAICSWTATCIRCCSPPATPRSTSLPGLDAGADDYLIKPVHEPELIARLNAGRRILNLEHSLRAANHRNRILSITDALTGAFNRRYLMEQLPREVERCRRYAYPLSVIMCDIDHFKRINDAKGHGAGDDVLQQFVARVQRSIRSNSDWIARYGGEEFLMVLPETDYHAGHFVAEKIRTLIGSAPFVTRAGEAAVTASFGVASSGSNGPDLSLKVDGLIKTADQCLYRAKQEGRNRSVGAEIPTTLALMANG